MPTRDATRTDRRFASKHGLLLLERHLPEWDAAGDHPRHRDDGVEAAELALRQRHGRRHVVDRGRVADHGPHRSRPSRPGERARVDHRRELLLGSEPVGQPRVVGAAVERDHAPAAGGEGRDRRRADAARGAGDDRDAGHRVVRAHAGDSVAAPRRGQAVRSATRSRRSSRPSRAVAPRASPSTPFGETARTPARAAPAAARSSGAVAPTGRSVTDEPRCDREHQRRLDAPGVRVAAIDRRLPARTGRPSARRRAPRARAAPRCRRARTAAPPRRSRRRRGRAPPARPRARPAPIDSVPGKPGVLAAGAVRQRRGDHDVAAPAAAASASAAAISVSVASGRCGPCCSVAPSGTTSTGRGGRARASGQAQRRRALTRRGPRVSDARPARRAGARSPAGRGGPPGARSRTEAWPRPSSAESMPLRRMSSTFSTPAWPLAARPHR